MKKLIVFAVVFALIAGTAFAQVAGGISINAWGRGYMMPLRVDLPSQTNGETDDGAEAALRAESGATWGGGRSRVDFRIIGKSEFAGFNVGATAESNELHNGDDGASIWVKPFSNNFLKLTVGRFFDDTLRGKLAWGYDGFESFVLPGHGLDEDAILNRIAGGKTGGAWENSTWLLQSNAFMVSSQPVDGLFLAVMVPAADEEAKEAYRFMHAGAGYLIPGIGHIRLQWRGGFVGTELKATDDDYVAFDGSKPARLEGAFALLAVDGLNLDFGFRVNLPVTFNDESSQFGGLRFSLGATFRADAFSINAFLLADELAAHPRKGDNDDSAAGMTMKIGLTPAFALDFATIGASIGLNLKLADTTAEGDSAENQATTIGFGVFISKGVGNGLTRAGVTFTTAPIGKDGANGSAVIRIPIILSYAFF